jgi:2-haloacid dehalogenase
MNGLPRRCPASFSSCGETAEVCDCQGAVRLHTVQPYVSFNTVDDLIAGTVAAIGTPVDFVMTAQQARAYKPDHQLFLHAYSSMGVTQEETIHVGMGQFTDSKVCHELGVRSVWIDRVGEPLNPEWPPHAVLDDLSGLPAFILAP